MNKLSYAYYRLPYADTYTLITSEQPPVVIDSLEKLGEIPGFVIAPFQETPDCPVVLITSESTTTRKVMCDKESSRPQDTGNQAETSPSAQYAKEFDAFHRAVAGSSFRKLVLARSKSMTLQIDKDVTDPSAMRLLYERACRMYPRLMIMLYSTPQSGTWLVASPEILMDGKGRSMHTVALAGTMPFQEGIIDWSTKNRQEQHVVEQYIENIVSQVSSDVLKDGPVTMRAGNLVHLRTDFRFHLAQGIALGTLVRQLHPTPAVCGMPKADAASFIAQNEGMERRYYSGFAGPVDMQGETHLYVALRCAELATVPDGIAATLYAGGGIMPDSDCQSEWLETESKMNTIYHVLQQD